MACCPCVASSSITSPWTAPCWNGWTCWYKGLSILEETIKIDIKELPEEIETLTYSANINKMIYSWCMCADLMDLTEHISRVAARFSFSTIISKHWYHSARESSSSGGVVMPTPLLLLVPPASVQLTPLLFFLKKISSTGNSPKAPRPPLAWHTRSPSFSGRGAHWRCCPPELLLVLLPSTTACCPGLLRLGPLLQHCVPQPERLSFSISYTLYFPSTTTWYVPVPVMPSGGGGAAVCSPCLF
ncbi:uncharacterized protein LOC124693058 [Lolium rigidum]|uniref:uncharacterized protein LOC124693058 n=1 Tax=Lolium rigidum TaxID=89674 RepID=UPI001F5D3A5C|nr:uncharacterized protein LOC124693058 [Lolium rigidum]